MYLLIKIMILNKWRSDISSVRNMILGLLKRFTRDLWLICVRKHNLSKLGDFFENDGIFAHSRNHLVLLILIFPHICFQKLRPHANYPNEAYRHKILTAKLCMPE